MVRRTMSVMGQFISKFLRQNIAWKEITDSFSDARIVVSSDEKRAVVFWDWNTLDMIELYNMQTDGIFNREAAFDGDKLRSSIFTKMIETEIGM